MYDITNHAWLGDEDEQVDEWVKTLDEYFDWYDGVSLEAELRKVYAANMAKSALFKEDLSHFNRQEGEPNNGDVWCSAWLRNYIIKHLARQRREKTDWRRTAQPDDLNTS